MEITRQHRRFFRTFGFLVMREAFSSSEIRGLSAEFNILMKPMQGRNSLTHTRLSRLFMDDESPRLSALARDERTAEVARALLGRPVICVQVAGARHTGDTPWHSDNLWLPYHGLKLLLYLDRLEADSGALRVLPGSHRRTERRHWLQLFRASELFGMEGAQLPGSAVNSKPGDLIALSLPLWHASFHGRRGRRMVEVNFYADPRGAAEVEAFTSQMVLNHRSAIAAGITMYPSSWRNAIDPRQQHWIKRLDQLGVLDAPDWRASAGRKADIQAKPPKPPL